MKALEVRFSGVDDPPARLVGTLVDRDGRILFEYSEGWLSTGLSLSPFRLPFRRGLFEHRDRAFGPLPGLFDDSLPDGWGLLLMDRHFRRVGQDPAGLSPLDRLAWLGTRTMGALTYHPPTDPAAFPESTLNLDDLARQSQEILTGRSSEVLPQLLRAGASPGGARPKVLVGFDPRSDAMRSGEDALPQGFQHWLVKFPAKGDEPDSGSTEFAYSQMARAAGLDLPETRLFVTLEGGRYFGVKRFDRAGSQRFHCHTFGNLIQADFRIPSADYGDLLRATALLTRDHGDVLGAFRQMVFNVFAHNRDDHVKNFGFRLDQGSGAWSLAPAYDLTFSPGPGGEHAMTVAGEGRRPEARHILSLAEAREVARGEATAIIDQVRSALADWPRFAQAAQVPEHRQHQISRHIAAP